MKQRWWLTCISVVMMLGCAQKSMVKQLPLRLTASEVQKLGSVVFKREDFIGLLVKDGYKILNIVIKPDSLISYKKNTQNNYELKGIYIHDDITVQDLTIRQGEIFVWQLDRTWLNVGKSNGERALITCENDDCMRSRLVYAKFGIK